MSIAKCAGFLVACLAAVVLSSCEGGSSALAESAGKPQAGTLYVFGSSAGPKAVLTQRTPAAMRSDLQHLTDGGGGESVEAAYGNDWIGDGGWLATVQAFGEPEDHDLFARQGYRYRTNLVDPESGVVIYAYSATAPSRDIWEPSKRVKLHGRLRAYVRQGAGVIVLTDAQLDAVDEASKAKPASPPKGPVLDPAKGAVDRAG